ncbi:MAG: NAD(P)H-binding protein [Acidobacteria bacterium]|jgi:nucleoside-diphosphate-sugar epimerase|nr:NAD(P)H-binding protein [Acidobacteriota bacterium]
MSGLFQRVVIVGATGPTGIHLARELTGRGTPVRVVSRSRERLERAFAGLGVEIAAADALDAVALGHAVEGCDLVVDAIGLPADRMSDHPRTARVMAAAAAKEGARLLQVSGYWAYLPVRRLPVNEDHPRSGGNWMIRLRREAEDVLLEAGAAVVQLPDFFGPDVHTSTLQRPLEEAVAGRPMSWIGSPDVPREYVFVPDAMRLVADLAAHEEAYGRQFVVPGSGPLTGRRLAELAGEELGREVRLRAAPLWLLRLLALVSRDLRAFSPMLPHYARPISFDAGRLRELVGEAEATPYGEAVAATLRWLTR